MMKLAPKGSTIPIALNNTSRRIYYYLVPSKKDVRRARAAAHSLLTQSRHAAIEKGKKARTRVKDGGSASAVQPRW
jgi:hypothetical protein